MLALRESREALGARAAFVPLSAEAGEYPFVYARGESNEPLVVAVNPSDREVEADFSAESVGEIGSLVAGDSRIVCEKDAGRLVLKMPAVSFGIFDVKMG